VIFVRHGDDGREKKEKEKSALMPSNSISAVPAVDAIRLDQDGWIGRGGGGGREEEEKGEKVPRIVQLRPLQTLATRRQPGGGGGE